MNKKTILEHFTDTWIQCSTEDEASRLLGFLHRYGFTWYSGNTLKDYNCWEDEKKYTYYKLTFTEKVVFGVYKEQEYFITCDEFFSKIRDIKKGGNKMNKKELVEFLVKNFSKYGIVDISGLDFSDISVDISNMKVGLDLYQHNQTVGNILHQEEQNVEGDLYQHEQTVNGDLTQDLQNVEGNLYQGEIKKMTKEQLVDIIVENFTDKSKNKINISGLDFSGFDVDVDISWLKTHRNLYQRRQQVAGNLYQNHQHVHDCLHQDFQFVGLDLIQDDQTVGGQVVQDEYKTMTHEEVEEELGYKIKIKENE